MFKEEDEQSVKRLTKNANISFTIEALCRILQNIAENCKTLQNSANSTPSSDKERGKENEESSPLTLYKEGKEEGQKENSGIAVVIKRADAEEEHDDDDDNPSVQVLDKDVQDFMDYWNAKDQTMFVPCQYLNGVQTVFLKRIVSTKGMKFIKMGIDICANAAYFQNSVRWGYKVDCGFFLDDENFSKIINHRYDNIHKNPDKYQQAVEDNRRNAYEDLQRTTREALESDEGLLGKL